MDKQRYYAAIGTACTDDFFSAPHWLKEGEKLVVTPTRRDTGGMVANAACVFAGYGAKVYYFDEMNSSPLSIDLRKKLKGYGLDTRYIQTNDALPDTHCIIVLTPGDRSILVVKNGKQPRTLTEEEHRVLEGATCIYSTFSELRLIKDYELAIDRWRKGGAAVAVDIEPSHFESIDDPLFSITDVFLFNRSGFEKACAGRTPEETVGLLFDKGAILISVTLDVEGCKMWSKRETVSIKGIRVDAVDTTGAGDTFNSSLVYRMFRGDNLRDAAIFATGAAARSVTMQGAKGGVTDEKTVRAFLAKMLGTRKTENASEAGGEGAAPGADALPPEGGEQA